MPKPPAGERGAWPDVCLHTVVCVLPPRVVIGLGHLDAFGAEVEPIERVEIVAILADDFCAVLAVGLGSGDGITAALAVHDYFLPVRVASERAMVMNNPSVPHV